MINIKQYGFGPLLNFYRKQVEIYKSLARLIDMSMRKARRATQKDDWTPVWTSTMMKNIEISKARRVTTGVEAKMFINTATVKYAEYIERYHKGRLVTQPIDPRIKRWFMYRAVKLASKDVSFKLGRATVLVKKGAAS